MKQGVLKGMVVVLVVMGLVAVAQPALAWVRVAVNVQVPFPVVVAPVATVVASPVVYAPPVPVYYRPAVYRPVWIPGHFNRWGIRVSGHWR
jgi:hypothetical protein